MEAEPAGLEPGLAGTEAGQTGFSVLMTIWVSLTTFLQTFWCEIYLTKYISSPATLSTILDYC